MWKKLILGTLTLGVGGLAAKKVVDCFKEINATENKLKAHLKACKDFKETYNLAFKNAEFKEFARGFKGSFDNGDFNILAYANFLRDDVMEIVNLDRQIGAFGDFYEEHTSTFEAIFKKDENSQETKDVFQAVMGAGVLNYESTKLLLFDTPHEINIWN